MKKTTKVYGLKTFNERGIPCCRWNEGFLNSLGQSVCSKAEWVVAFLYLFWATSYSSFYGTWREFLPFHTSIGQTSLPAALQRAPAYFLECQVSFGNTGSLEEKGSVTCHHLSSAAHLPNKGVTERKVLHRLLPFWLQPLPRTVKV